MGFESRPAPAQLATNKVTGGGCLFGTNTVFRKNLVSNLNDDALVLDAEGVQNLRVSQNVIEQCLTGLSFAQEHVVGPVYIYRNLVDLRRPTAGTRPHWDPDTVEPLRYGHLFKENGPTGPVDLVHNTFVVTRQSDGSASYGHFTDKDHQQHRRRSFNNIFVAVNPEPIHDRPITFLPTPPGPGLAEGNCYHRRGHHSNPLFRFRTYPDPATGNNVPGTTIANVPTLHAHQLGELGVEAHTLEDNPGFKRFTAGPTLFHPVDLRLDDGSPCRGAAADLPSDLPTDTSPGSPDIGATPPTPNHSLSASTENASFRRNSSTHQYLRPKRPDARDVSSHQAPTTAQTRESPAAAHGTNAHV